MLSTKALRPHCDKGEDSPPLYEDAVQAPRASDEDVQTWIALILWMALSIALLAIKWSLIAALDYGWPRSACVLTLTLVEAEGGLIVATGAFLSPDSPPPPAVLAVTNAVLVAFSGEGVASCVSLGILRLCGPDGLLLPLCAAAVAVWNAGLVWYQIRRYPSIRALYYGDK